MSTRRVVSDQPRNWSQESSSSQEEFVVYSGNRVMQPERQPTVPPAENRAQQDKGFARFLEKHSSPTHQRVTAGGRIVPMEQRPRPPVFSLPSATKHANDLRKDSVQERPSPGLVPFIQQEINRGPTTEQDGNNHKAAQSQLFIQPESFDKSTLGAGLGFSPMLPHDLFGSFPNPSQSPTFSVMQPAPFFAGLPIDPYAMQSPQLFPVSTMPFNQSVSTYAAPVGMAYPPPVYPYGEMYGFPSPQPAAEIQTSQNYCQHMLLGAKSLFEELDKQLKSIDRHRAMNNRDINLANQRMAVVQQRSDAKKNIGYWEEQLAQEYATNQCQPLVQQGTTLNVRAPTYVPATFRRADTTMPLSAKDSMESKTESFQSAGANHIVPVKAARRAIPIVAPPESSPPFEGITSPAAHNTTSSPVTDHEVDEWGVRLGRPPPHIERQQSEMLEALLSAASKSLTEQLENVIAITPQTSSKSSSFHQKAVVSIPDMISESDSERAEWLTAKPGRAPATVEAYYESQLDAMRLPQGWISKVRLPDGTMTEVPGRGLQRPPSFEMDDFERRYWTSKPTLTREIATQFVDVRRNPESGSADQLSSGLNNFDMDYNSYVEHDTHGVESRDSCQAMHQGQGNLNHTGREAMRSRPLPHEGYYPVAVPSAASDPSLLALKQVQHGASSSPVWSHGDDRGYWLATQQGRSDVEVSPDAHVNKGFSSVSIQNVHAMGRLPHMLDGATDGQRVSAKTMLSAAGKVRSPRLIHRSTATGGAWFGPHSRDVLSNMTDSKDVFRSGTPKGECM